MSLERIPDSLAEHLDAALAPCRIDGLLSREWVAHINAHVAGRLPASMTTLYGFECRLWDPSPAADLLVCTGPEPEQWPELLTLASRVDSDPWRRVRALLDPGRNGRPVHDEIATMWVEFDLVRDTTAEAWRAPSVFIGSVHPPGDWLARTLDVLTSGRAAPAHAAVLACHRALPPVARLFQIGVMLSRPSSPVRICARGFAPDHVRPFLQRAGWPGDLARVDALVAQLRTLVDDIRIDLDGVDGRLSPAIGLECYLERNRQTLPRLARLLEWLQEAQLCLPQKTQPLLQWNGLTHERHAPALWPPTLLAARPVLTPPVASVFFRWLHHIKLQLPETGDLRAKAYLAVVPGFATNEQVRRAAAHPG